MRLSSVSYGKIISTQLLQQSIVMRGNGTTSSTVISQSSVSVKFFLVNSVSLMTYSYGANNKGLDKPNAKCRFGFFFFLLPNKLNFCLWPLIINESTL